MLFDSHFLHRVYHHPLTANSCLNYYTENMTISLYTRACHPHHATAQTNDKTQHVLLRFVVDVCFCVCCCILSFVYAVAFLFFVCTIPLPFSLSLLHFYGDYASNS